MYDNIHPSLRKFYIDGRQMEMTVRTKMLAKGIITADSTELEDRMYDIDAYIISYLHEGKRRSCHIPVSIKCNEPKYYSAPFIFELYEGEEPRWFYTGRATKYVVWKRHYLYGGRIWVLDKGRIIEYVAEHGFDRIVGHTEEVMKREALGGHEPRTLGLLKQDTVVRHNLGVLIVDEKKYVTS